MNASADCTFIRFGLLVTGVGEEQALPDLLRPLAATGLCHIQVIRRVAQRNPRKEHILPQPMITGTQQRIPDRDFEEIGAPARAFLAADRGHFVLLIDDLEHDRRPIIAHVFERYRNALNAALREEQRGRAAVHFLVPMLEAYYFAHADAVNAVLDPTPPLTDYPDDVETMRHPKGDLKQRIPGFDEVEHGVQILSLLDLDHILARADTCASLRGLIAWCVAALRCHAHAAYSDLETRFCLSDGVMLPQARTQIAAVPCPPMFEPPAI
ncbi:MAG: DUF4276 family protein [Chloroflexales bacterium]